VIPNIIIVSISYFYLLHAFWLGVGAYEAWSAADAAIDAFGFPIISRFCLLVALAVVAALVGTGLRLMIRCAYLAAAALSSLTIVITLSIVILGVLAGEGLADLIVPLFGIACHGSILAFLHADSVQMAFGPISWQKIITPSLSALLLTVWLFLAVIHMNLEGQRSVRIVMKPHPTLWPLYSCTIRSLPRDQEGFVYPSKTRIWYRNWTYLSSYQLSQFDPETIW
jgi:hypothetical protein